MKDITKYQGVIPAFYACYDEDGEISAERTEALALHFLKKGVKGLYVNGSSGECIYQSVYTFAVHLVNVFTSMWTSVKKCWKQLWKKQKEN